MLTRLIFFSFLLCAGLASAHWVHTVERGDTQKSLQSKYADTLQGKSLLEVNPHVVRLLLRPKKQVIVNADVHFDFCEHKVQKNEYVLDLLRKYSYDKPLSLNLLNITKQKNSHISDINKVFLGDIIYLPRLVPNKVVDSKQYKACAQAFAVTDKSSFLDRQPANTDLSAVQVIEATPIEEFTPGSEMTISLGGVYDSLHQSENGNIVLVSELQSALGLEWRQLWSPKFKSLLGLDLNFKNYNDADSNGTFINRSFTASNVYIGVDYLFSANTEVGFQIGYGDQVFFSLVSGTTYSVTREQSLSNQLQISQKLISNGPLSLKLLGAINYFGDGQHDFKGGIGYGAGLKVKHQLKKRSISGQLTYQANDLETTSYEFEHRLLQFMLDYSWEL